MIILRVAPSSEFRVRDDLHRLGLSALVPVEFTVSRFGKRRETIRKTPVIRGYVFARLDVHDWQRIRHEQLEPSWVRSSLGCIKGAVFVGGRRAILTATQTAALELLSRPVGRANACGWSPGDKVRVRRGAFAELDAVVSQIKRGTVIATIEMMGKLHTVKLHADQLEAA